MNWETFYTTSWTKLLYWPMFRFKISWQGPSTRSNRARSSFTHFSVPLALTVAARGLFSSRAISPGGQRREERGWEREREETDLKFKTVALWLPGPWTSSDWVQLKQHEACSQDTGPHFTKVASSNSWKELGMMSLGSPWKPLVLKVTWWFCARQKDRVLLAQAHHIMIKHLTNYLIWWKLQGHSSSQILSQEKSGSGLGTSKAPAFLPAGLVSSPYQVSTMC